MSGQHLIAGRSVPVAGRTVAVQLAAVYTGANGRITLARPCTFVSLIFTPNTPGAAMGSVKFMINAVDQDTYDPSRADKGFQPGDMTSTDAKLRTNFGVAGGAAKQQWHEWPIGASNILNLPFWAPEQGMPKIKTIDLLLVPSLSGVAAVTTDVYAMAAE